MRDSCQLAGFSLTKARQLEGNEPIRNSRSRRDPDKRASHAAGDPVPYEKLSPEAQRAWTDFAYFQRRYFGRKPLPWQEDAANKVVEWLLSPEEEYVVCNAPPGVGKTLLFTHDIPIWLIVRNRAIRILLGAITGSLASRYTTRIRNSLEATIPLRAKPNELAAGSAFDAEATLAADFGRFKPLHATLWTKEALVVAQYDDLAVVEKEPTIQSYGFDSEFIGNRVDFANWDDLVNPRKQRSQLTMEQLRDDWDDQAETRLEPQGLLMLTGQRLASNDLYRYNLDKRIPEAVDEETGEILSSVPKYRHICYPAHWEDRCEPENHRRGSPAWPEGCLLAPERLPWRKISGLKANNRSFNTVYQQEDVDPEQVLVPKAWVYGEGDFPGCMDRDRDRLQLPMHEGKLALQPPLFSAMSVDPSPSAYWGIQWWVYQQASEQRFLVDLAKKKMRAPDFLDYNPETRTYSGLLEEWWQTSRADPHLPRITHLIVEINAAQRFMLQYKFFNDWLRTRGVQIVSHTTHKNKSDPEYGVWTVRDQWRLGRVRLPGKANSLGKLEVERSLIAEVTSYPQADTTDQVMAQWFFEFQLPRLFHPDLPQAVQPRPSWMKSPGKWRRAAGW
jgi:hypothetical protein